MKMYRLPRLLLISLCVVMILMMLSCRGKAKDGIPDALVDNPSPTQAPQMTPLGRLPLTQPSAPLTNKSMAIAQPLPLGIKEVKSWAIQLQDLTSAQAAAALTASTYDMIVIEPVRTGKDDESTFDTRSLVSTIKDSFAHDRIHRKLVIAYVNIGQAEDYRWYWTWTTGWDCKPPLPAEWPDFILSCDPDGWSGNYPVAYWDVRWKDIILYGFASPRASSQDFQSALDEVLQDGFDGIYMDWVAAFEDETVISAAETAGVDPASEMAHFIKEIRTYTRRINPSFLLIQQNGAALAEESPQSLQSIDAISHECIWYCGDAADTWGDPQGYDKFTAIEETEEIIRYLNLYIAQGLPVFDLDYAINHAGDTYAKASSQGYVPYISRTSLSRLTTTPPDEFSKP